MNNLFLLTKTRTLVILLLCLSLFGCSKETAPISPLQTKVLVVIADHGEADYVPTDERVEVIYTGIGKLNTALEVDNFLTLRNKRMSTTLF